MVGTIRGEIRKSGSLGRLGTAKTFVVPIVLEESLQGVIRVTGLRALPWHLHQGLDTLASQVALALDSAERAVKRAARTGSAASCRTRGT